MIDPASSCGTRKHFTAFIAILLMAAGGCAAFPGVVKLAQPQEKPSQDHFSCGEKCRSGVPSAPPKAYAGAKYEYPAEH